MKTSTKVAIGVGSALVVGVAAVGVGEHYAHAKAPSGGGGGGGGGGQPSTTTLQPNTKYTLVVSCPTAMIPVPLPQMQQAWAGTSLLAGVPVNVESVSTTGGSYNGMGGMVQSLTAVFTYTGSQPMQLPSIAPGNGTPCSVNLQPTVSVHNPGPHQGGFGGHQFPPQPQVVNLVGGTSSYSASVDPGGTVTVKVPQGGRIQGVSGATPTAQTGTQVVFDASQAATIQITWTRPNLATNPPTPIYENDTLTVS